MRTRFSYRTGYVGLLVLLVTLIITIFLYWQLYLKSGSGPGNSSGLSQDFNAIQQARDVRNVIESQSREAANKAK